MNLTQQELLKLNELDRAIRITFARYQKKKTLQSEQDWRYWTQEKINFMADWEERKQKVLSIEEYCLLEIY